MTKKILIAPRVNNHEILPTLVVDSRLSNFLLNLGYLPILLPISQDLDLNKKLAKTIFDLIPEVMGVIIQGGKDDVDENLYSSAEKQTINNRDHFEMEIIQQAISQNKPLFGICRGMQMINVALGGTLIPDLGHKNKIHLKTKDNNIDYTKFNLENVDTELAHDIVISKQSPLYDIFGEKIKVNSVHHQAIDKLGQGLTVDAVSEDGVIEIVSNKDKKILGVQFHPEFDLKNHNFKAIINYWLDALG